MKNYRISYIERKNEYINKIYVEPQKRKKIAILTEDYRINSGVGNINKILINHLLVNYNIVHIAGGLDKHPNYGQILDGKQLINEIIDKENLNNNIKNLYNDIYFKIYPVNNFGNREDILNILNIEKDISLLIIITDPRFFYWLFAIEDEIRLKNIPILYYHVWDNGPTPYYNWPYYQSCDYICAISNLTYNIVKQFKRFQENPDRLSYVPHGVELDKYFFINRENYYNNIDYINEKNELINLSKRIFNNTQSNKFVFIYNGRNAYRKNISVIIEAFNIFFKKVKNKNTFLLLKTDPNEINGPNLLTISNELYPESKENVFYIVENLNSKTLNYLYNISNAAVNASVNEGFGIPTLEMMATGGDIIATVTGGLQDQMGFLNDKNEYFSYKDLTKDFFSNYCKKFEKCGSWAFPVFPKINRLVGSQLTPYIYEDYITSEDLANKMIESYEKNYDIISNNNRNIDYNAIDYIIKYKMTAIDMVDGIKKAIDYCLENENGVKRDNIILINVNEEL